MSEYTDILIDALEFEEAEGSRKGKVSHVFTEVVPDDISTGDGPIGQCLDFLDGTAKLRIANADMSAFQIGTGSQSIEFMVNIDAIPASGFRGFYVTGGANNSDEGINIALNAASDTVRVNLSNGTTRTIVDASSSVLSSATWHHIVAIVDRDLDEIRIYIDGTEEGSGSISGFSSDDIQSSNNLDINGDFTGPNTGITGLIDHFRIYNDVLSDAQITYLYNSGDGRSYYELADQTEVYYPLNEGGYDTRGTVWADLTKTGNPTYSASGVALSGSSERLTSESKVFRNVEDETFCIWGTINVDSIGTAMGIAGQGSSQYSVRLLGSGTLQFRLNTSGGAKTVNWGTTLAINTDYFFYAYHDKDADVIGIAVNDGTPVTTATSGDIPVQGSNNFTIGSIATGNHFDGTVKNIGFRRGALLSAAEETYYAADNVLRSEIERDYNFIGSGAKVWDITAQSSEMGGSGTFACPELIITEADLPDELHDTDEAATVEALGAGSLRLSSDAAGAKQMPLKVVKFVPGAGGGDVLLRTRSTEDLDAGSGSTLKLWWFPEGNAKTQPPATNIFGAKHAFLGTHYELEEDPSGTAPQMLDSGLNGNDGTTSGLVSGDSVAAHIGDGIDFSSADYIDVDDDDSLSFDSAFTISLYFNMNSGQAGYRTLISKRDNALSPPADWGINFNQTLDVFQVFFHDGSGYNTQAIALAANFSANTWYRVDFTCEESGVDVITKIYKDGVLLDTETWTSKSLGNSAARVRIGAVRYSSSDGEHFDGLLDEITIQEGALSQGQITTLHNNKKTTPTLWDSSALVQDPGASGATLVPADGAVAISAELASILQQHNIVPSDGAVGVTAEETTLDTNAQLLPQDGSVGVSGEATTLQQNHLLAPADGSVGVSVDPSTIEVGAIILIPADGSISVAADGSLIVQNHTLVPADGQVAVTVESTIAAEPSDVSRGFVSMAPYHSGAVSLQDH